MENTKKCTICRNLFDADDAAILTMSGYGNARYICPECSSLLDVVTLGDNYDAIKSAMDEIGQKMAIDVDDTAAVTAFAICKPPVFLSSLITYSALKTN